MANNPDLEYIKKHYSESLAHLCRSLFPTILEKPGLLPQILEKHFAQNLLKPFIKKQEEKNKQVEINQNDNSLSM